MKQITAACRGILVVGIIFAFAVNSWAAGTIVPNWNINNKDIQTRSLSDYDYDGLSAIFGAGSVNGRANNNSLTITNSILISRCAVKPLPQRL